MCDKAVRNYINNMRRDLARKEGVDPAKFKVIECKKFVENISGIVYRLVIQNNSRINPQEEANANNRWVGLNFPYT